ncbi:MAG: MotA/TolQ/ExbB proton channel family protein [Rhabdochlamydiaceae bacterium]|nr:MotA/TolQ/ExbB proton channel family protein [Candidatus Amphrikana amoebophyrae]
MASFNILFQAFSQSDSIGKMIFFLLFALSIITWTILIQKMIIFKRVKQSSDSILKQVEGNQNELLNLKINSSTPYGTIFSSLRKKLFDLLEKNSYFAKDPSKVFLKSNDIEMLETHIDITTHMEMKKLDANLYVLHTIVSLAPFVGILGTVWGILISLNEMQTGSALLSNTTIIGGLSTALGTTVLGLTIAIPALIAHNFLKNRHKEFYSNMQDYSHFLLSTLQMQYQGE